MPVDYFQLFVYQMFVAAKILFMFNDCLYSFAFRIRYPKFDLYQNIVSSITNTLV